MSRHSLCISIFFRYSKMPRRGAFTMPFKPVLLWFFMNAQPVGGFHKQVQSYLILFLIISTGLEKPFFFLGLLFNFSMICFTSVH